MNDESQEQEAIAIIGMSCRVPGADSPEEFWQNLINGKDTVSRFEGRAESAAGKYVGARGVLDQVDKFDASFFGIYPKEAELMDPQHRMFLECAWTALEDGCCDPSAYQGMIGVYAGLSLNTYLLHNLNKGRDLASNYQVAEYQTMLGNDKDFLPVRVSYKLDLRGPSMAIQTACSTSLVAICQAATALMSYQCDMALAGGVSISFPQKRDYLFQEEGMVSPDGTCRAFDANAAGTVFGHGCGVILMKRLSEAKKDGDAILGVIRGWAVNNDGSDKIGFAAPGMNAQAEVIAMAQASAGVHPSEVSYVEAHGTGTPLGDPIEVSGLTKAFREGGAEGNQFCALGTGKTHIGHLDCAAGVVGLIKTLLQFRHGKIPGLLHYQSPNPRINFSNSPFAPVSVTREWPRGERRRIAGVSAFGVGGTNAHVVLEEPPLPAATSQSRPPHVLTLSAKSATALDRMVNQLADYLENESPDLGDVAYTLATGRKSFAHRCAVAAVDVASAAAALRDKPKLAQIPASKPRIAFLFPGQGSQYVGMGREIYDSQPVFKDAVDECALILRPLLRSDIRATLYPSDHEVSAAHHDIDQTAFTQPCIFVIEYALAKLWMSWGIEPSIVVGHSIGEYVAAVLAGTFTLEHALNLLSTRARLMQGLPGGSMLAVRAPAESLNLPDGVNLAAINSPSLCTVSGTVDAITAYQGQLEAAQIGCRLLKTSHAFHSMMMEPIVETFGADAAMIPAAAPSLRWISTLTGKDVDESTLSDSTYWARQLRSSVNFAGAMESLFQEQNLVVLEVGPGQALAPFARQHPARGSVPVISTLPDPSTNKKDLFTALAELWKQGVDIDWNLLFKDQQRRKLHLPTYAFDRLSYWIDNSNAVAAAASAQLVAQPVPIEAPVEVAASPQPAVQVSAADHRSEILTRLRAMVLDLSGIKVSDDSATFTELGFDSLFLTQASQGIQSRFGVKVTFRQMLGDLSSLTALADHLVKEVPATSFVTATPAVAAATSDSVVTASSQAPASNTSRLPVVRWPEGRTRSTHSNTRFGPYKPLEKGEQGELTSTQQAALDRWIERYVGKTPSSKAYAARHRSHYADPRAVAGFKSAWKEMVYPIVSQRTKGSKLWDIDGNEYVDITMGFGTYLFGHSPDWLIEAIEKQLKSGIEIGPQSPIAGKLAQELCELTQLERVTFCNTGSEAVMAAMRLARTVTGRDRIVYFTGDYHGMFDEVLVRGSWVDGVYRAQPIAPGIPQSLVENMLVLDYADPTSLEILKQHAHELAAVMIEPVQSRSPGLQPRDFMREVRAITKQAGAALIFDEIVTGFRCAPGGAQSYFGVHADLATYGKVVGGGMPIGILAGTRQFMDALDGGMWQYGDDSFPEAGMTFFAGTFVRHPLALAAAWRVIEHLKGEGPRLQIEISERVGRLCRALNEWMEHAGVPIRLSWFSAYVAIEYASDLKQASLLWYLLREKGIHVWEGRPLYFTTAHSDEDMDRILKAFAQAVIEMQAAGFLPSKEASTNSEIAFPRFDSAPTTEAQREIFHAVFMGDEANCSFNESNVIQFKGTLDKAALRTALGDLIARHPALRSTFSEDGATQYFHPSKRTVEMMEHDFSSVGLNTPSASLPLSLIKNAESSIPFDLTRGPLFRLHLVRLTPDLHELVFTAHHIICDGWSFGMLIAELATAYNARKSEKLPMLPPAMSFAEYARMEVANRDNEETTAAENFWISKFEKGSPVMELPTDRPRPQVKTYAGAMESMTLDAELFGRLKKASPSLGGTMFATLLSAFAAFLHRITGQEDMVIGVPAAGQTRIGCDELVGHCLNFLPLRLTPGGDRRFNEFASEVKDLVLEAYDHQNYTFGSLLRKIKVDRDTSRVPLVSVIFNIDKSGFDSVHFDGLGFDVHTNPKQFVNFDLFFNLVQSDDKLVVECEYNKSLHDSRTIRRWLGTFERLIHSAVENGADSLQDLDILTNDDRKLLDDWNATDRLPPAQRSMHRFFEDQVERNPNAVALRAGSLALTYLELDRHANALARRLASEGVGREVLVGICAQRRAEMLISILAVLKAGGAYVPIDPNYPQDRIAFILNDAKAPILLTQRSLAASLPQEQGSKRIFIDEVLHDSGDRLQSDVRPSDLAYVIYTSGSTGTPKGVAIEHHNAIALIDWALHVYTPEELGGTLFSTSICFDLSIFEIFVTLASGGAIILAENALELKDHPHRGRITLINTVPSAIATLVDENLIPPSVRTINLAGEALSQMLVDKIYATVHGIKVYDLYGPSEDTTYSTYALREAGGRSTIGRPIWNTKAYIVSSRGKLLPPGVAGELLLGGSGITRGYLNRPELTAERFIPNEYDLYEGARLYRTGDRARFFDNGEIQYLGRLDHQVKLRGFRIELGEIESLLEEHPTIEQAVATVRDNRLIAYVRSTDAGEQAGGTEIWKDQWDLLYKSAIDQTGSGKLDQLDQVIAGWADVKNLDSQVTEWIDTTVDRIRGYKGGRIFEIGCGTGQILSRLADSATEYWAADISKIAVDALRENNTRSQVKLLHRPADDFSSIPTGYFDTVIINSVAQYFPNADYLARVLEGAAKVLAPGGRIFLGDVQSNALLAVHHAAALRERASEGTTSGALRQMVARRVAQETELSIDPPWFEFLKSRIPTIAYTEILLRRGAIANETTTYHYDAILHVSPAPSTRPLPPAREWRNLNVEQLEAMLVAEPDAIHLISIPDARLLPAIGFKRALDAAAEEAKLPDLTAAPSNAATAENLFALAAACGFQAHVKWRGNGAEGLLEAVFLPQGETALPDWPAVSFHGPASLYANVPHVVNTQAPAMNNELRKHLARRLPEYMIPSAFVVLTEFPLTPNGKVDRKALPAPVATEAADAVQSVKAPRNETEAKLLEIWKEVLGNQNIGIDDDIFELGGDSILIFQISTRSSRAGLPLTPAQVFRQRNIAAISAEVMAAVTQAPQSNTIARVNRDAYRRNI